MKRRRKKYTDHFRRRIVARFRQGLSANQLSRIHRVDQTTISRWVREMSSAQAPLNGNPPASPSPERSEIPARSKRDSSENLEMLLLIRDVLLPRVMQECRGHIVYCRMTACLYPTREYGEDDWRKVYMALSLCLRDVENMALHLKIDHLAMRVIHETFVRLKEAWLNYRAEHFSSGNKYCDESGEIQANDCLGEEREMFNGLICKLRELVVGSRWNKN